MEYPSSLASSTFYYDHSCLSHRDDILKEKLGPRGVDDVYKFKQYHPGGAVTSIQYSDA